MSILKAFIRLNVAESEVCESDDFPTTALAQSQMVLLHVKYVQQTGNASKTSELPPRTAFRPRTIFSKLSPYTSTLTSPQPHPSALVSSPRPAV